MANKQLSWRCSNRALFLFCLFSIHTSMFSMSYFFSSYNFGRNSNLDNGNSNNLSSSSTDPSLQHSTHSEDYALVPVMTEEEKKHYTARGKTWQELTEVFEDAHTDMQDIVDHLTSPSDPEWRAAFVVGPPGTGKTTATLAIPHLARWYWRFLSGPELSASYRNQTKERLSHELVRAVNQKRKTVVIIDELNKLLENFDSKGHDTDSTSAYLWTFLDKQKRNNNFFFVGIMNRDDKIPDQVKHRFGGSTIYFPAIEDPEKLRDIFKKVIARNTAIEFDEECDDAFFDGCFSSLNNEGIAITPRDYENIRFQIARLTRRDDRVSEVRKIKQAHVRKAIYEVAKAYDRSGLGREHLTDEEWRDFNALQNRIIEIKLNWAQTYQFSMGFSGYTPTGSGSTVAKFDPLKAKLIIEEEFSPDQIAVYRRVMKLKPEQDLFYKPHKSNRMMQQ